MSNKVRRKHTSKFKAKVALAVLKGEAAIPVLAARPGIRPKQIDS